MRYEIDLPGYHNHDKGQDVPRTTIRMHSSITYHVGEQIDVPDGGVVQIVNIRHRPFWTNGDEALEKTYGLNYAYHEGEPLVVASWVTQPLRHD